MSNYPVWWDTTITVFSKRTSPTSLVTWHKATINNCFWKHQGSKVNVGDVLIDTESIICRIPSQSNFIDSMEWMNKADEEVSGCFTLQQGDIIVRGACEDEINEYQSGKRSTDLISKYRQNKGCMEIKDVAINTMTGMVNPHYNVRGL